MVISLVQLEYVYKLLNKKNMCNNNCNENNNTTTNQCGCKTSTDDVVYNGPELTCTNIQTCDTLTSAISNISNFLCSIDMVQIIINNITNNINLYNQFTTIVNNTVDCETVWDCISATTTTTTTAAPMTWIYDVQYLSCEDCTVIGSGLYPNSQELIVGEYYLNNFGTTKILILELFTVTPGGASSNILTSSGRTTCEEIICPTTTTTTTLIPITTTTTTTLEPTTTTTTSFSI